MRAFLLLVGVLTLTGCDNVTVEDKSAGEQLPLNADGTFNHDALPDFCPDGTPMLDNAQCADQAAFR